MKTSTESSKTELSSRGKRPFKVFGFSRFFLPQTVPRFDVGPRIDFELWFYVEYELSDEPMDCDGQMTLGDGRMHER